MRVHTIRDYGPSSIRIVLAVYLNEDKISDFTINNENFTYVYLSKFTDSIIIVKIVGLEVLSSSC
jgi:hypothetical protein